MSNIEKTDMKKLDVTNAYEVDCTECNRSFIIDCGEDIEPMHCPYCGHRISNKIRWGEIFTSFPQVPPYSFTINGGESIPLTSVSISRERSETSYYENSRDNTLTVDSNGGMTILNLETPNNDWRL